MPARWSRAGHALATRTGVASIGSALKITAENAAKWDKGCPHCLLQWES
ncbi:MAG: hypothetical protein OJF49_003421 [Ktedonobacterales bacterium]|nr:MAG: hypothetical protein OJF49_003421 [Ktedonobacterales bacterium]